MEPNTDNRKKALLQFFSNSYIFSASEQEKIAQVFQEAKAEFYDHKQYKWTVQNCRKYVEIHALNPSHFIGSLKHLFNSYFERKANGSEKGAMDLIQRLKDSKRFTSTNIPSQKIPLQEDKNVLHFLEEMKVIHNSYLDINQKTMIRFIFDHFETGYTFKTLERKFKDQL